jgi:6,7-dimethyl-8-ribityllumazine synthase
MSKDFPVRPPTSNFVHEIAIVASLFNEELVNGLIQAARQELALLCPNANLSVYRVPGSFEIPVCAEILLNRQHPDLIIAFGLIIRGDTAHGDLIADSVTQSLQSMSVRHQVPIIHEVLLVQNLDQAKERCLGNQINRGVEAARAATSMLDLLNQL